MHIWHNFNGPFSIIENKYHDTKIFKLFKANCDFYQKLQTYDHKYKPLD